MDVVLERCAGIDIGGFQYAPVVSMATSVTPSSMNQSAITSRSPTKDRKLRVSLRRPPPPTPGVLTHATTSSLVWYVLEERALELKLVNAHHLKILPGRKSDVLDAEWIAELVEHGLLRGSFVPPRARDENMLRETLRAYFAAGLNA